MTRTRTGRLGAVEVRSTFREGHWASGFEVAEIVREQQQRLLRIRRRSDGVVLPVLFSPDDVRRVPDP